MLTTKASIMAPSMRTRSRSSISSSDADGDNIECGFSSHSINDDVSLESSSSSSAGPQEMVITLSKLKNNGKIPRRRSQCSQLSFRRSKSPWLSAQMPPFSTTSTSSSPERKDLRHLTPNMATLSLAFLLFIMTIFTFTQQHSTIESMRLQLDVSNQHRTFLEKSASNLQAKVASREGAMNHCRDAHLTLSKQHKEQRGTVRELEEEIAELRREIERLKGRDKDE